MVTSLFKRGLFELIPDSFLTTLQDKKKLRIKFGADPSAPDLHLGHMVVLNKLRLLQEMGHTVIFLIGDFTAMIGDPTGKSETRPVLSSEQINDHVRTYQDQVFKLLKKEQTEIVYNSTWLQKLTSMDLIRLSSTYTVARMLERDDFEKRFSSQQPIGLHEFIYPLLQGYDSVVLKNDVEIGGSDQKFNVLMGRFLQKEYGCLTTQNIVLTPLLQGLDGVQKMSKSLKNYVALTDSPKDMFGKLMSIQDHQILDYFSLLTFISDDLLTTYRQELLHHPKDLKMKLAKTIVAQLYDDAAAIQAEQEFNRIFSKKGLPDVIPTLSIQQYPVLLSELLVHQHQVLPSKKEFQRLISQGAIFLSEERISDPFFSVTQDHEASILKVGKRQFFRLSQ